MPAIDLGPFGFPGKTFSYHGRIVSQRQEGKRLLFLFDEAHSNKDAIQLSILNACALWGLGVLGCVGVEEYPFWFAGWEQSAIEKKSGELFQVGGNDEGVIQERREGEMDKFRFGKTLKLLRPALDIRSVDEFELYAITRSLHFHACSLTDSTLAEHPQAAKDLISREFDQCPTNRRRDEAFINNLLPWWEQAAQGKAAILNAGTTHHERVMYMLPADIRYIRINTMATV